MLLIFIVGRRFFDGPVDGIVYAATVASGFAFTENIQYFGLQVAEAGGFDGTVGEIFIVRGHPVAVRPRDVHGRRPVC